MTEELEVLENKIRISYTTKGTIPLAKQYSNVTPSYTITKELPVTTPQEIINLEYEQIKEYCDQKLLSDFERIEKQIKESGAEALGHRVEIIDGVKTPHVNEIISPEQPPIPFLEEHGALGTWFDKLGKHITLGGKIEDFSEPYTDTGNIKQTSASIREAFIKIWEEIKDNFSVSQKDIPCYNQDFNFIGSADLWGEYRGESALIDLKKTEHLKKQQENYFMQLGAYSLCMPVKYLIILTPYELSITENVSLYQGLFLIKRGIYKERFGI